MRLEVIDRGSKVLTLEEGESIVIEVSPTHEENQRISIGVAAISAGQRGCMLAVEPHDRTRPYVEGTSLRAEPVVYYHCDSINPNSFECSVKEVDRKFVALGGKS